MFLLFLLTPLVWSSAPAEPFLAVKRLIVGLGAAALAVTRGAMFLDWGRALLRNRGDLLVAGLAGWAVFSAACAPDPAGRMADLLAALPWLAVFVVLRTSVDAGRAAIAATAGATAILTVVSVAQLVHMPWALFGTGEEPIGLLGNRNHLASYLAMSIPLVLGCGGPLPMRRAAAFGAIAVLFATRCRGAMLALLAAVAVLGGERMSPARRRLAFAVTAVAVGLAVLAAARSPTGRARLLVWRLTAQAVAQRPLAGHGPGAFAVRFPSVQEAHFRGLSEDAVRLDSGEWRDARNHRQAHDDWLQLAYELGLPAMVGALALWALAIRNRSAPPGARAGAAALGVLAMTTFPLETPATALIAVLAMAAALPGWRSVPAVPESEPWPLWPRAWLATGALLMAAHTAFGYLSEADAGRGRRLLQAGKAAEAEKPLKKALFYDGRNGRARAALGRVFEATGRPADALAALRDSERDHLDSAVVANSGIVLRALGRREEAVAAFRRAIEVLPTDSDAWYFLGMALEEAGLRAQGIAALQRAKELTLENYKASLELALAEERAGDRALAAQLLKENLYYLFAVMAMDDPTMKSVDPVRREYVALNARELERHLAAAGKTADLAELRTRVARLFGRSGGR